MYSLETTTPVDVTPEEYIKSIPKKDSTRTAINKEKSISPNCLIFIHAAPFEALNIACQEIVLLHHNFDLQISLDK